MSGTDWRTDGSLSDFGGMTIVVCGLTAFGLFSASFRKSPEAWLWMLILVAALIGAWLYGGHGRRERKYLSDYCERFDRLERADIALLEGCRDRSARRDAIRLGLIQDDGLSNLGRELAANTELAKRVSRLEALGVSFPDEREDLFECEGHDRKIELAWKRKQAADKAWRKLADPSERG